MKVKVLRHSVVSDSFVIPRTVACQAPLSMEFSRQEYWSGEPFASPGDLPNPGIEPRSSTLWADPLPSEPAEKPKRILLQVILDKKINDLSKIIRSKELLNSVVYQVPAKQLPHCWMLEHRDETWPPPSGALQTRCRAEADSRVKGP